MAKRSTKQSRRKTKKTSPLKPPSDHRHIPAALDIQAIVSAAVQSPLGPGAIHNLEAMLTEASLPNRTSTTRIAGQRGKNIRATQAEFSTTFDLAFERSLQRLSNMTDEEWSKLLEDNESD